ncbi:DUF3703 domain-containing protein [Yinghuangia soli]|uniref:DUF3703 domain-containing protein n=1 Tax=Yinghuangia soli TaxID=2908204 RepID=A0AA41U3W0_9ACTN|nr:DUF3703 domain-containing protein [Yinghuangia soli]MCF2532231.1 DUF3703 domain-containing protein [Yinghuangia soli]
MPDTLRAAYTAEMAAARAAGPTSDRWRAAERAHILSQSWPGPRTRTHAVMLRLAALLRDAGIALGPVA